jgi:murein DD-endopeptidase MepM/ murein hydrolase activator NlpD
LPNAVGGVQRAIGRVRPSDRSRSFTARRLHRLAIGVARRIVDRLVPVPTRRPQRVPDVAPRHLTTHRDVARSRSRLRSGGLVQLVTALHPWFRSGSSRVRLQRRLIRVRLRSERALPMFVALAVIAAGVVSLGPGGPRPVGAAQAAAQEPRIAIGGTDAGVAARSMDDPTLGDLSANGLSAYIDDGTFYKPVAVDTQVESGRSLLQHYTVKAGDTLTGIASQFGVSMMTLWWANHLAAKDSLHQGEVLVIPPVNGLVITVQDGDTLDALGTKYNVDPDAIMQLNNLSDPMLVVGQVLILPGAKGAPIPTPKVTPAPRKTSTSSSSSGGSTSYTGGSWAWPVPGGYIIQYFHYGHYGVDIAAPYGSRIIAAHSGTITYAGWNSDGCGYEVRIYIGNNIYIQNCHMSSVGVHVGQSVYKGQFVGRVGMSGWAYGPHDHFAVSVGKPFSSGAYFINPLRYY